MRNILLRKILEAQRGNQSCTLDLIRTFQQLPRKYACKLYYEDTFNDLVASLIEVVYKIKVEDFSEIGNDALINHTTQSINHAYFKLSKRADILSSREQHVSDLTESQQFYMENAPAPEEEHLSKSKLMLSGCNLTNAEKKAIIRFSFRETSVSQIAREMRVSRQNANQIRNRAIRKLRKIYG